MKNLENKMKLIIFVPILTLIFGLLISLYQLICGSYLGVNTFFVAIYSLLIVGLFRALEIARRCSVFFFLSGGVLALIVGVYSHQLDALKILYIFGQLTSAFVLMYTKSIHLFHGSARHDKLYIVISFVFLFATSLVEVVREDLRRISINSSVEQSIENHYESGVLLFEQKQYDAALIEFKQVLAADSNHVMAIEYVNIMNNESLGDEQFNNLVIYNGLLDTGSYDDARRFVLTIDDPALRDTLLEGIKNAESQRRGQSESAD